jgi:hypothetical protein
MSDLFDAAAERNAIASGRPKSQELAELRGASSAPALPAGGLFVPGWALAEAEAIFAETGELVNPAHIAFGASK